MSQNSLIRTLNRAATLAAILVSLPNGVRLVQTLLSPPTQIDFAPYYQASIRLLAGDRTIYQVWPGPIIRNVPAVVAGLPYQLPPAVALGFGPLTSLPYETAELVWMAFNFACAIGATVILCLDNRTSKARIAGFVLLLMLFSPFQRAVYLGQVTCLLYLLLAGAYVSVRHNRDWTAGALIGAAALVKIFPITLLVYFAWRRRWRVVFGGVLFLALVTVAVTPFVGLSITYEYVFDFLPRLAANPDVNDPLAQVSLPAVANWALADAPSVGSLTAARIGGSLAVLVVLGVTGLALFRTPSSQFQQTLEVGIVLSATLLTIGRCFDHYLLLLGIPLVGLLFSYNSPPSTRTYMQTIAAISFGLIVLARYWRVVPYPEPVAVLALAGNLVLFGGMIYLRTREYPETAISEQA